MVATNKKSVESKPLRKYNSPWLNHECEAARSEFTLANKVYRRQKKTLQTHGLFGKTYGHRPSVTRRRHCDTHCIPI